MTPRRIAQVLFLLAILAIIVSPFGLLLEPPIWVGVAILLGGVGGAFWFSNREPPPSEEPVIDFEPRETGAETLAALRAEKDRFFKNSQQTPLMPSQLAGFHGLNYYSYRPGLVFAVSIEEFPEKLPFKVGTSTGEIMEYLRWGEVRFPVDESEYRLTVYRADPYDENLFIPFADATSGKTTYGAGRYLELIELEHGAYLLDFNRAYNPYCAYNSGWSCPLPPPENRLTVAIEAGERTFEEHRAEEP